MSIFRCIKSSLTKILIFLFLVGCGIILRFNLLDDVQLQASEKVVFGSAVNHNSNAIRIGVKIDKIYLFSDASKTFNASGIIWLLWSDEVQGILGSRNQNIDNWLNFVNLVNDWDSRLEPLYVGPIKNPEGFYLQGFRFSGQFYVDDINFHKYPFHSVRLPIIFEIADYSRYALDSRYDVKLISDESMSGVGSFLSVSGYIPTKFNVYQNKREIQNIINHQNIISIDQAVFEVQYKKSVTASLVVHFIPLLMVMLLVIMSPILSNTLWDFRISIPPTALLTLIFLQQGVKDNMPDIPYVMYIDTVYNICYVVVAFLFCFFVWASNKIHKADKTNKERILNEIDSKNKLLSIAMPVLIVFICVMNWLILSARYPL